MGSTRQVCGTFSNPVNPDRGACSPYRLKETCERPVVPIPPCNDVPYMVYDPDEPIRFRVVASLFDTTCALVTDQGGQSIFGPIT